MDSTGAFAGLRPQIRAPSSTSNLPHCGLLPRAGPWPQGMAGGKSEWAVVGARLTMKDKTEMDVGQRQRLARGMERGCVGR